MWLGYNDTLILYNCISIFDGVRSCICSCSSYLSCLSQIGFIVNRYRSFSKGPIQLEVSVDLGEGKPFMGSPLGHGSLHSQFSPKLKHRQYRIEAYAVRHMTCGTTGGT